MTKAENLKDGQKVKAYYVFSGGRLGEPVESTVAFGHEARVKSSIPFNSVRLGNGEICHKKQYRFEVVA